MRKFYAVIIGTEILLGRRVDKHFEFLKNALAQRGFELSGSFVVKDDEILLQNVFSLFANDKEAVIFCFGGIGATPDDLTRQVCAKVFTNEPLKEHIEAKKLIEQTYKDEAYPHRIQMANLPLHAKLLKNVVNNVPGFSLEDRLFFMPGFPQMSHPMVIQALDLYIGENKITKLTCKKKVFAKENDLLEFMQNLPPQIELSSLPHLEKDNSYVEIMLRSEDINSLNLCCEKLQNLLKDKNIKFEN